MLDNSMVMWLPELADGNAHNNNNLPIVIAGSGGGYLKQGQSINVDTKTLGTGNSEASCANGNTSVGFNTGSNTGNVPLNKLFVTLINAMGKNVSGFSPVSTFGLTDYSDANGAGRVQEPGRADDAQGLIPRPPQGAPRPDPAPIETKQSPRKGALSFGRVPRGAARSHAAGQLFDARIVGHVAAARVGETDPCRRASAAAPRPGRPS
jgi:hypothetical protein